MREITTQQPASLTGATLYAVLDRDGLRWNGAAFEIPAAGRWALYAVPMAEDAGTAYFAASVPPGVPPGVLDVTVYHGAGTPADPIAGQSWGVWDGLTFGLGTSDWLDAGVAQGGTAATITLAAGSAVTAAVAGAGFVSVPGQRARVLAFDGGNPSAKVLTVDGGWYTPSPPAAGTPYRVDYCGEYRSYLAPAGLDQVGAADPSAAFGSYTFRDKLMWVFRRLAHSSKTPTTLTVRKADGTALTTQAITDDGAGTQTSAEPA